jgi:nucleotide-binding universal stress UspA family protein
MAALQKKKVLGKILVPLDGSKVGESALRWAETLAQTLAAELILFQVVMTVDALGFYQLYPSYVPLDPDKEKASAMAYLESVEKSLAKGLKISRAVGFGSAADAIIDYAIDNNIDLIAISSHGRSGIGRWVFGSVTDKILHFGETALLVVRAAKT